MVEKKSLLLINCYFANWRKEIIEKSAKFFYYCTEI